MTLSLQATASGINRVSKYKKPYTQQYKSSDKNEDRYSRMQPWRGRGNSQRYGRMQPDRMQSDQRDHRVSYRNNQPPDRKFQNNEQSNDEQKPCRKCGHLWHSRGECPAKYQDCAKCGTVGHYARMCINIISDDEDNDCEEDEVW